MKEKGIDELLYAMKKLYLSGYQCSLYMCGTMEENYKDIIKEYSEEGWLNFIGYVKDVRPYIEEAHCMVLPSWHEGMSNTNLECAAMGRPIITSNIPGCQEAVKNGKSGFLCKVKDKNDLYEKMKQMIELSYEERLEMGNAGRKHMINSFDKKSVVNKTIENLFR